MIRLSWVRFDMDIVHFHVHMFVCAMCLCCRLGLSCLLWHITCG